MLEIETKFTSALKGAYNFAQFYIEGYTHDWAIKKGFETTVNVSRGLSRNAFDLMAVKNPLRVGTP